MNTTDGVSRRRVQRLSVEERQELLARYERSELPQREFAAQEGVPFSTFTYWLRRFRRDQSCGTARKAPAVVPLQELRLPSSWFAQSEWVAEIQDPRGRVLRLSASAPAELVQQLVNGVFSC